MIRLFVVVLLFVTFGSPASADQFGDAQAARARGDHTVALELYRSLAAQGNASAQIALGWMYLKGEGAPVNLSTAQTWFGAAADNPVADQKVREDAAYNRDFLGRKMKEQADADAAAERAAAAATAAANAEVQRRRRAQAIASEAIQRGVRDQEEANELIRARSLREKRSIAGRQAYQRALRMGGTLYDAEQAESAAKASYDPLIEQEDKIARAQRKSEEALAEQKERAAQRAARTYEECRRAESRANGGSFGSGRHNFSCE